MDFESLSKEIASIQGDYFFFKCPTMDFTDLENPSSINIIGENKEIEVPLPRKGLNQIVKYLFYKIFQPGKMIICWDIKNFFSYVLHHTGKDYNLDSIGLTSNLEKKTDAARPILLDLKILERYNGINKNAPNSYVEAVKRLRELDISRIKGIYKKMHVPLFREVLPHIENLKFLLNDKDVYTHYEIEGTVNGRLKVESLFKKSFNPHTMDDEKRSQLKVSLEDHVFLYLDFSGWEVRIAQWVSGDRKLGELLERGDVYLNIFEAITGKKEIHPDCRKFTKNLMLPVIFGSGARGISENLEIKQETAAKLINKLYKVFPDLFNYLRVQRESVYDGIATDSLGRKRLIKQGQEYLVMNFCIQSPAATICLCKLIDLYNSIKFKSEAKLAFSIHDGFGIVCNREYFREILEIATKALESESEVAPGLKLKIDASAGINLGNLKKIKRKE